MAPIGQTQAIKPQASNPFLDRAQSAGGPKPPVREPAQMGAGAGAGVGVAGGRQVGFGQQSPLQTKVAGIGGQQNGLLHPSRQNGGMMPTFGGGLSKVANRMDTLA